jgi:putative ABC transport system ATP-binding protein
MVSGGQQQHAAMARALANHPPILIADEPMGNLGSKTAKTIFGLFNDLATQGKTVIIVTHDALPDVELKVRMDVSQTETQSNRPEGFA